MKVLRRIAIAYSLFMLLVLGVFILMNRRYSYSERDLVYYNDICHIAEKLYSEGVSEEDIENKYDCHIIISTEIHNEELAALYKNYAFVIDFAPEGNYIGKIAWSDEVNRFQSTSDAFFKITVFVWAALFISGITLIMFMYRSIVRPIRELERFSEKIASGCLEEPLPIHKDNIFGRFVEAFDLMREQVKEARQKEIESEKARKELVAELSHDVKTPVSVIKAACEVMQAKCESRLTSLNDSEKEADTYDSRDTSALKKDQFHGKNEIDDIEYTLDKINTISSKADTIGNLMSNLMHANLEDMEVLSVNPIETDTRVIPSMISNIKNYGNIIIENDIPECLVYMDKLRMEQAIDNIVGNSYKYAGTDIRIRFSNDNSMLEDGTRIEFVKVIIKDSGCGVSEEDLPLIAEKYYRGKNTGEQNGYGLGLYLVKCYMDKMGGGMEYYNDNGFTVELLLKKV